MIPGNKVAALPTGLSEIDDLVTLPAIRRWDEFFWTR
jgi:hypothetical protein